MMRSRGPGPKAHYVLTGPSWTSKIHRENEYFLFMDPFGSDQSRHVDDFGAKARHVDDILAKNRLFDGLLMKIYELDALCYPVVCIKLFKSVGKTNVF